MALFTRASWYKFAGNIQWIDGSSGAFHSVCGGKVEIFYDLRTVVGKDGVKKVATIWCSKCDRPPVPAKADAPPIYRDSLIQK